MAWFEDDAASAWRRLARNGHGRWPARDPKGCRLEPIARPGFDVGFSVAMDDKVFTIGSCFARNIERSFVDAGFDVPARNFSVPPSEVDESGQGDPLSILNKYTPFSMEQEVEFALADSPRFSAEDCLVEDDGGLFYDMQLAIGGAVGLDRGLERREQVRGLFSVIRISRIVFLTLGLSETWFDRKTGIHLNRPVPLGVARRHKGRFVFQVADIDEIRSSTLRLIDLLQGAMPANGKIVITVSPVPLNATFTAQDVIVANEYSKAALRVAASEAVVKRDEVYYYPSYESVTLSASSQAWYDDLRHVRDELVRYNTGRFMAAVSRGLLDVDGRLAIIQTKVAGGELDEAIRDVRALCEENGDRLDIWARLLEFQVKAARSDDALKTAAYVLARRPLDRDVVFLNAQALFEAKRFAEANDAFLEAERLGHNAATFWRGRCLLMLGQKSLAIEVLGAVDPKAPNYIDAKYQLGIALIGSGDHHGALRVLSDVVEVRPKHSGAYCRLSEVTLALGQLDAAERNARIALTLQPSLWLAHYQLGVVEIERGLHDDARVHLMAASRLNPDGRVAQALAKLPAP